MVAGRTGTDARVQEAETDEQAKRVSECSETARRQDETRDATSGTDAKLADDDGEGYLKGGEATEICETKWEQGAFVQVLPWSERSKLTSESSTRLGWGKKRELIVTERRRRRRKDSESIKSIPHHWQAGK